MSIPKEARRQRSGHEDAIGYCPVLILGAGLSGITLGCQLKRQLGFDDFQILDRQSGIGGKH